MLVENYTPILVTFDRQGHSCNFYAGLGPTIVLLLPNPCLNCCNPNLMLLKEIHTEGEHLSNTADNVRVHTVGPIFLVHTLAIQIYCSDPLPKNLEASMQRTLLACFVFLFSLQQILVEKFFVWLSHPHTKSFRKTFSCILATHCHIHLVFSNSAILSCPPANEATSLGLMLSPSF